MKHIPRIRCEKEDDRNPRQVYEGATTVGFTGELCLNLLGKSADESIFARYTKAATLSLVYFRYPSVFRPLPTNTPVRMQYPSDALPSILGTQ
ncbi:hypothetical protein CLIM01_00547 [Colletotrichum limetticola]|uniref:Uncharacterized protein n=1 Tax=Colletotrichum limetticola TaxID=1209924 RepID=A0ABQ9QE59_9PEZI|nr:hypothetical protein CLIM01_00547 [Colletotrichum limetticola]